MAMYNGDRNGSFADDDTLDYSSTTYQDMDESEYLDKTLYFERGRIQQLKDERVHIQKKTFTKWCNSFLTRVSILLNLLLLVLNSEKQEQQCVTGSIKGLFIGF